MRASRECSGPLPAHLHAGQSGPRIASLPTEVTCVNSVHLLGAEEVIAEHVGLVKIEY